MTKITDVFTHPEIEQLRRTISHVLHHPDYATGEEVGRSFHTLEFGQPLPLEIVIRDWRTELEDGTGGREEGNCDCYSTYPKLYEGGITMDDLGPLLGTIM